jgi:nuclear pore complex protein Nup155
MVFTNRSLLFYNKLRPVDVLYRIFIRPERTIAEEQKECQSFFERYGKVQSCAMCLSIICNIDDPDVVNKAKKLFFELGGVPTAASATQAPGNHLGQVIGQIGVNYSGRHDGFVLYFARLVASIWHLKVFANR